MGTLHLASLAKDPRWSLLIKQSNELRYLGPRNMASATTTTDAAEMQPIVMTREQFSQLGQLITGSHADNKDFQRLQQAAAGIDRCDGVVPEHVRAWIRDLDGWQSEEVSDQFMIKLAKATTTGDLLEEIRARVNDRADGIKNWLNLRAHIVKHFLSACEDIKLQTHLETIRQRKGESTPAYIRRFRSDANRAYGTGARAATEETRVVASFLRGLADRLFAERLYRTGRVATLESAIKVALEKEAEREKMEQMLRSRDEEPVETGVLDATGQLLGLIDTMRKRLEQVTTRLAKIEASKELKQPPKVKKGQWKQGRSGAKRPAHKWDSQGRPLCSWCGEVGHMYRECNDRSKQRPSPSQGGQ